MVASVAPASHLLLAAAVQASLARGCRFYGLHGEPLLTVSSVVEALTTDRVASATAIPKTRTASYASADGEGRP